MKCTQIKADGIQCKANATNNSSLCFSHNPDLKERKLEAVKKGGANRQLYAVYGEEMEIETAWDIQDLLQLVINGILIGKIPCNQPASTLASLSKCWLEAHKLSWEENSAEMMSLNTPASQRFADILNMVSKKESA